MMSIIQVKYIVSNVLVCGQMRVVSLEHCMIKIDQHELV
jgi:hypothetical protein